MKITSSLVGHRDGKNYPTSYEDKEPHDPLTGQRIQAVHGYCFYQGKLLVVFAPKYGQWTPAGGSVEAGETYQEALVREVKEETNMRVISQELIGCLEIVEYHTSTGETKNIVQTRSFCIVEPYGPFVSDPDGDITEIRAIDPLEYKKYFDWGEVGDHVMKRALEMYRRQSE